MVKKNNKIILDKNILVLFFVITITFMIIYHKFIFQGYNYVVVYDAFYQFTSYFAAVGRLLRSGQFPDWSFQVGIGGVFNLDLMTDLFSLLIALINNESAIIYVELLKAYLTALFCYKYLEKLNFDKKICIYGAVSYSFCGIMIIRSAWYSYTTEMMYFVMILFACELFFQKHKRGLLIISIVLFFGRGSVHQIFLCSVFLLLYSFTRHYIVGGYDLKKCMLESIKVYLISILLSAVFILPSIIITLNAGRFSNQVDTMKLGQWLPEKDRVLAIICSFLSESLAGACNESSFQPDGVDGPLFYVGIVNIFLIVLGIKYMSNKTRRVVCVGMVFWLLYLFCPNVNYLYNLGISNKYYKLFVVWMVMFLIVLACLGLKSLACQSENRGYSPILYTCFVFESLLVYITFIDSYFKEHINDDIALYCMLLLLFYTSLFICMKKIQNIGLFLFLCLLIEYIFMAYPTVEKYASYSEMLASKYDNNLSDICNELYSEDDFFRIDYKGETTEALKYNFYGTSFWNTYMGNSYLDFLTSATREYTYRINRGDGAVNDPLIEQLLGVRYKIKPNGTKESANYIFDKSYDCYDVFYNPYANDLITVFDKYIYEEEYNAKCIDQRQLSLLDTLVVKKGTKIDNLKHDISEKKIDSEVIHPRLNTWADMIAMSETEYEFNVTESVDLQFIFDRAYAGKYTISFVMMGDVDADVELFYKKGVDENSLGKIHISETGEHNVFDVEESEIDYFIIRINKSGKYKINNFLTQIENIYSHPVVVNNSGESSFKITSFKNNHIIGWLETSIDGKALISIPCEKGWKVYVDGRKTSIDKVDFGLMAFDCKEGSHIVELIYKRPGLMCGMYISLITLFFYIGYGIYWKRKSRNSLSGGKE